MSDIDNKESFNNQFNFQHWRERFLRRILYVVAAAGLLLIIVYALSSRDLQLSLFAGGLYGLLLLITFLKFPHNFRAALFLLLIYFVALASILDSAALGVGSLFFLGLITLSVLIVSPLAGWITTGASILTITIIGWLFVQGTISPWTDNSSIGTLTDWLKISAYLLVLAIMIVRGVSLIQQEFIRAQQQADITLQELSIEKSSLSDRVESATTDLNQRTLELKTTNRRNERRAEQFEAISQVVSSISSLRSMEELLPRICESVSQQYGFYHVGIFLNDPEGQFTILSSASSPGGKILLANNYRLKIGEEGIVGYVTQTGLPRISLDVDKDVNFIINVNLKETRSEMTLPLKIGNNVIGALDIQSTESSAFLEEDVRILLILANQVSMAIDNVYLFEQTNRSLIEAESLSRQYLREGWNRLADEEKLAGFRYNKLGTTVLQEEDLPNVRQGTNIVEVPILLRGERVGAFILHPPTKEGLSIDQMDIVKAVAERVALSAENARLFSEVSRRAEREKTVSQITGVIRSTTNPQIMIQTALDELKKALGVTDIEIRPYSSQDTAPEAQDASDESDGSRE